MELKEGWPNGFRSKIRASLAGPEQLDGDPRLGLAPLPIGNLVGGRGFGEVELRGRYYRRERTGGREEKEIIVFKIYVINV